MERWLKEWYGSHLGAKLIAVRVSRRADGATPPRGPSALCELLLFFVFVFFKVIFAQIVSLEDMRVSTLLFLSFCGGNVGGHFERREIPIFINAPVEAAVETTSVVFLETSISESPSLQPVYTMSCSMEKNNNTLWLSKKSHFKIL